MIGARPLTRTQIKAVLHNTTSKRENALMTLGFCTGYRISELLSLKVCDVVSKTGKVLDFITVRKTKNGSSRTVKLNSDAQKAVKALANQVLSNPKADHNSPLFLSGKLAKGNLLKAISRQHADRLLKAIFEQAEIFGNVSTHTLRKTYASLMYQALGGKLEKLQVALGHKSITSTIAYLSFNHADIDQAIEGLSL
jgi:site-specific recombinase XerD